MLGEVADLARGLILDFFGVLTSNMVEVIEYFEDREKLARGTFLRGWADPAGKALFAALELGEISQREWNVGFAELIGVQPDDLMARYLADAYPAYQVLNVAKQARAAGIRTAVLSNSLGRSPYDPYAGGWGLRTNFDEVVLSTDLKIRKPDPRIFQITADKLGLTPQECVFVDDTEENLVAAARLGMRVLLGLDEAVTASKLRMIFDLPAL
jgi:putative hydrolase of the HAD superfamily